jgi:hypothetical protein
MQFSVEANLNLGQKSLLIQFQVSATALSLNTSRQYTFYFDHQAILHILKTVDKVDVLQVRPVRSAHAHY